MTWVLRHSVQSFHHCNVPHPNAAGDLWRCDGCGRLWRCAGACTYCDLFGGDPPECVHAFEWSPATWWQRIRYRGVPR